MSVLEITTKGDQGQGTRRFVVDDFQSSPLEASGLPAGEKRVTCVGDGVYVVTVDIAEVHGLVPHSQLGQDLWVLAQLGHKRGGVFVDVGAHDGIHFSNTYLLEKEYGWTGVCVECGATYEELKVNRTAKCLPYAAWRRSGDVLPFHQHELPMLSGLSGQGQSMVETISLNDICAGLGPIDYLSLDTEGSELEILSTFDFERFNPKCMTIEHNGNTEALGQLELLFRKHGYLWRVFHWDVFAVKDAWGTT